MIKYNEFHKDPEIFTIYLLHGEEEAEKKVIEKRHDLFESYPDKDFVNYIKYNPKLNKKLEGLIENSKEFNNSVIDQNLLPEYKKKIGSIELYAKQELKNVKEYILNFEQEKALKQRDQIIEELIRSYQERYGDRHDESHKKFYIATLATLSRILRTDGPIQLENKDDLTEIEDHLESIFKGFSKEDKEKIKNYFESNQNEEDVITLTNDSAKNIFMYMIEKKAKNLGNFKESKSELLSEVNEYEKTKRDTIPVNNIIITPTGEELDDVFGDEK